MTRSNREVSPQPLTTADKTAFGLPGVLLVVDPDDAADLGAFPETALTPAEAWESNSDESRGE